MPPLRIIELTVIVIVVVCLIVFARRFHELIEKLERQVTTDHVQQDRLEATVDRMEKASHIVADNLADSVSRADATEGPDGAAADAALRTGDSADAIRTRQDDAR